MPQRAIDVRLADCSGADDAYGHLAHELISNGLRCARLQTLPGEVHSTLQVRVRGNRRSPTWSQSRPLTWQGASESAELVITSWGAHAIKT
jgi:hypothetical protein